MLVRVRIVETGECDRDADGKPWPFTRTEVYCAECGHDLTGPEPHLVDNIFNHGFFDHGTDEARNIGGAARKVQLSLRELDEALTRSFERGFDAVTDLHESRVKVRPEVERALMSAQRHLDAALSKLRSQ